ncbi:GNAT family N-acetyltransferase [Clostridium botulinum]|uniref:Acetyltransferase (GNAT) family n=1 Tax=Clostridium botulinum TaxID=1491 RepID=A0A126JHZ6_CLOBO|nr:GNAT family N-acetyltransferase [Clostridium botulinum]ALT05314.1 acetyltransferase (GNAT) family [Clostridium botulinum]NFH90514.1 GNAT family N-acetyltransferase [Clostridium botulinum]NFI19542.1 GNAT family N-acetyltransferase [Clostridium botulinum]NFN06135.1 GNAT family N-acetyltransferase [Clostridium botulinum]NFN19469.1 GNAT family N-acetyltransferase [Clostridium botulinum]
MSYEQQRALFINAIEKMKTMPLVDTVELKSLETWEIVNGKEKAPLWFPSKIQIEYEIKNIGNMSLELQTNLNRSKFEDLEIVLIDINSRYRLEGYGRKLIDQAKKIASKFNVRLYGDYMDSSKEFYKHCGFNIKGRKFEIPSI